MTRSIEHVADAFWEVAGQDGAVDAFVSLLREKGLVNELSAIVRAIESKGEQIAARQRAIVRTAHALAGELRNEVGQDLEGFTTTFETDESLIGGIEVRTFDRRISGTVQSMLGRLRQSM